MSDINLTVEQSGSYNITVTLQSPATIEYVTPGPQGVGIPEGGDETSMLAKNSSLDYDMSWKPRNYYTKTEMDGIFVAQQGNISTEIFNLTQTDIDNKYVELSKTPSSSQSVNLYPLGGIPQINGQHFTVSGKIVSWNGLGLDGFLESGDTLIVLYI